MAPPRNLNITSILFWGVGLGLILLDHFDLTRHLHEPLDAV
jgi:hypothetical protein